MDAVSGKLEFHTALLCAAVLYFQSLAPSTYLANVLPIPVVSLEVKKEEL